MTTQYVQLNAAGTAVITAFGGPQPVTSDKPGYTTIDSSDARWVAFQNLVAAQQAFVAALQQGVAITSTGTSALNGTYPCDKRTQQTIVSEQMYIASETTFTNGGTTLAWPDIAGTFHIFPSTAEFTAFAKAVGQYVQALNTAYATVQAGGGAWVAPSNAITIP
jgi:hypothetical protein